MPEVLNLETVCHGLTIPGEVKEFRHAPGTRVVFAPGELDRLGRWARPLGRRALLVTDRGLVATGFAERAVRSLEAEGIAVMVFDSVHENPTTEDVARCVEAARGHEADLLVGLGGGSSMDAAKGCNFLYTNGGEMRDYWGREKATRPMLPLIAVPTTAGTGSECQSFALISDAETHRKMACGDRKAAARIAILDPELTLTQPRGVTANTAVDALSHAIESYVSRARGPISARYALAAFRLLSRGVDAVLENPSDLVGRGRLQLGAAMAGTAIENSMLGAAHSAANPLTARFDVVHGQAVGIMLPAVIRFNAAGSEEAARAYGELLPGERLDRWFERILRRFELPLRLLEVGVDPEALPGLSEDAAEQWTAQFNPVPVGAGDFERLYREVLGAGELAASPVGGGSG